MIVINVGGFLASFGIGWCLGSKEVARSLLVCFYAKAQRIFSKVERFNFKVHYGVLVISFLRIAIATEKLDLSSSVVFLRRNFENLRYGICDEIIWITRTLYRLSTKEKGSAAGSSDKVEAGV